MEAANDDSTRFLVEFDGPADSENPRNWSMARKVMSTIVYGLLTMGATWSSAIYSTGAQRVAAEFHVTEAVASLGTSFLLIGFGIGPLLWSPLSEIHGRKFPVLIPYFVAVCFTFGTGVARNIQTVLITRFFVGFFSSAPLCITGGALADLFDPQQRGLALLGYAMAVVGGPVFAPVAGSAIVSSSLGWRWTQFITGIYMAFVAIVASLLLVESYPPVILATKARRLRFVTGQSAYYANHERWHPGLKSMASKFLLRPIQLLKTPICFLFALHASFVYSIVYLNIGAFPIIFRQTRGWSPVVASLPFLALIVGIIAGTMVNIWNQTFYLKKVKAAGNGSCPEARLPPMMAGAIVLTGGLFIMANTAEDRFPWIAPIIAAAMMGFGFFTIFQAALNYLVDNFPAYAASAVAANAFLRSSMASIFPPLTTRMYNELGVRWATNLLAFVALAMTPIPWLFYFYGRRIAARGKFSQRFHAA
ncbi:MFS multidrug transporter [Aspergillus sclerotiicarbonarius CBS 121057]|uniref:MFS multidrug transporter n=1 Tax=Aspergillus sclerotiicarbonarius (strain CBS 121057 / IBT 28362) TaxID=1448318 RepID=A0A319EW98_ASPSB|nr:MFS multidrug transporter [Aspergillus sclerotiicarbonarius CBS 121057]